MDVYRQAAEIIRIVQAGKGTAKALCLRKEMQKKKQTYAVVCETLRHYELLEDVLAVSEFFKYYPSANREVAFCMAYDVVLGKGVSTKNDSTARAIHASASYLREAYWQVHRHHSISPRIDVKLEEEEAGAHAGARMHESKGSGTADGNVAAAACCRGRALRMPRYARVNTLKVDLETLVERLRHSAAHGEQHNTREGLKRKRKRGDEGEESAAGRRRGRPQRRVLPPFSVDPIVPSLLVFPPDTDLHAHPAVRCGQLVLQDRASCLPACVLLGTVPVLKGCGDPAQTLSVEEDLDARQEGGNMQLAEPPASEEKPLEYVIDACAAPGNKTTHLAALGAPQIKIMATERDERRAELLEQRVRALGAADYVNVVNQDFFNLSSDDRDAAEGILLDPSCSASGVVSRVDVALMQHPQCPQDSMRAVPHPASQDAAVDSPYVAGGGVDPDQQGNDFSTNAERIEKLARLQRKLLAHALLSFSNCRTVVYSTCSVHEAENEGVVRQVLADSRVQSRGWHLSNIMPDLWATRGVRQDEDDFPMDYAIRCDPVQDATNGFFVARFDRAMRP